MSLKNISLPSRLRGGVWGHLVGDALGVPYEFRPPSQIGVIRWGEKGTHNQMPGTWSDDGGLMLALLDSLLEKGFDLDDQAERALAWQNLGKYRPGEMFDIGNTTSASLLRIAQGVAPLYAGGNFESDNGNGSLMKILPLALVQREVSSYELIQQAMQSSSMTHGHNKAKIACAYYCLIARELLLSSSKDDARRKASISLQSNLRDAYHHDLSQVLTYSTRTGSGYVLDSFYSALEAFHSSIDFVSTIESAIKYGFDTDTTACIAGGLAGIYYGVESIPSTWLKNMRGQDIVQPLLERLLEFASPKIASK